MTNDKRILMRAMLMLLLTVTCAGAWGGEVTADKALLKAQTFVNSHLGRKGGTPDVKSQGQVNGLYVFNIGTDGGFVIVSNDDRTTPILGYGDSGSIDPDNLPANLNAWLQGYADQIAWVKANVTDGTSVAQKSGTVKTDIGPLITTQWNQDAPYNNLCPEYSSGNRCATGCVATAYAQVMYYTETVTHHNTTTATAAEIPGYTTRNGNHTLAAIPAGTVINWSDMIADYDGSYTEEQAAAVANMMLICGCAVQMNYGRESGAYTKDVAIALKTYFGYAETTRFVNRSCYTYDNWTDLIYNELDQGRPVVYAGQGSDGGHEFVCDGYKYEGGDLFHINWGWGGMSDGYFVLSVLNPDEQGIGGSPSSSAFTLGQEAVIGIQKTGDEGTVLNVPTTEPNNLTINSVTLSHSTIALGERVDVTVNVTNNSATNDYDGEIDLTALNWGGMFVIPAGGTQDCVITVTPTKAKTYTVKASYYTGTTSTATSTCSASLTVKNQTPTDLTASNVDQESATIGWTNVGEATTWNLRTLPVAFITEDFNGSRNGWSRTRSTKDETHGINGSPCVKFGKNGDNQWLVTPKIAFGGKFSIYAWKSGETAEDFSVLYSKDSHVFTYLQSNIKATTTPTEYTVDLSGLSGEGWIAIIHFGGTEGSYLYVDDATIVEAAGDWTTVSNLTANSYSLTGLTATPRYEVQVQAVNNDGGNWSNPYILTTTKNALTLLNSDSEATTKNTELLKQWNGLVANVTLSKRTLYKDGDWNTLCLPFDVSTASGPLSGDHVQAMVLDGDESGLDDTTLTLNFDPAPATIPAGTPFIVKWDNTGADITDPVFQGVKVSSTTPGSVTSTDGYVTFLDSYAATTLDADDRSVLFLGSGNNLYWPSDARPVGAFRAWFVLNNGLSAGEADSPYYVRLYFGEDETTRISAPLVKSEEVKSEKFYSLDGRRLDGKPTKKGLYIVNGRKVVVK